MPILIRHTDKDKILSQLKEDIKKGNLRRELRDKGYKECFAELSMQGGVIMRGQINHPKNTEGWDTGGSTPGTPRTTEHDQIDKRDVLVARDEYRHQGVHRDMYTMLGSSREKQDRADAGEEDARKTMAALLSRL